MDKIMNLKLTQNNPRLSIGHFPHTRYNNDKNGKFARRCLGLAVPTNGLSKSVILQDLPGNVILKGLPWSDYYFWEKPGKLDFEIFWNLEFGI
jgi:hypothetical protein